MICKRLAVIIGQKFGVTILRPGWHTVVSGPSLSQSDAPFAMTLVFIPSLRQELEFEQNVFCVLELVRVTRSVFATRSMAFKILSIPFTPRRILANIDEINLAFHILNIVIANRRIPCN